MITNKKPDQEAFIVDQPSYEERDEIAKAKPKPMVWHNGRRYSADAMASASAPQPGDVQAKRKEEITFENWSAETKRTAKTKTLGDWPDAPTPPTGATDLERLTYPRGLLGHVVEYIYSTAQLPDRFMALAGALSACGKCLDRKVLGPTGNSTILYILLIAETGSGKQHIINCIRMILRAAGMEETIVASGIASVQAIEEILEGRGEKIAGQPSPLVLLDEYGSFLNRISSKGQTGNVAEIPGILQTLWGWPPELEWTGSIKVLKERVTVLGPAFTIFATSTERAFFTALKSKQVASGFVNRHALINAGRGAAKRIKPAHHWTQCPAWLVQALREVSGDPMPNAGAPLVLRVDGKETMLRDFRRIGWGPGAEECWSDFENEEIRALPSIEDRELWIRAPEIALRLATIVAVFRGSATVEVADLEWSIELIRQSTKQLSRGLQKHMLEEYAQADLVAYIREQFRLAGLLTLGQIRKLCERKTDDHRKIGHAIDHLVMCGDIEEVGSSGPGRPTRRWKWIG